MLRDDASVECQPRVRPCSRRVDDLKQRDRAFSVGAKRDSARLLRVAEKARGIATSELLRAYREHTNGFDRAAQLRGRRTFLSRCFEQCRIAVGTRALP